MAGMILGGDPGHNRPQRRSPRREARGAHERLDDPCFAALDSAPWLLAKVGPAMEANMKRTASARWRGDLKQGTGSLSTQSGTLKDTAYSFAARFESGTGTNPEELIAAAHAGCFTMALAAQLGGAGFPPQELSTQATL